MKSSRLLAFCTYLIEIVIDGKTWIQSLARESRWLSNINKALTNFRNSHRFDSLGAIKAMQKAFHRKVWHLPGHGKTAVRD